MGLPEDAVERAPSRADARDPFNLRAWFAFFLAWMILLTWAANWGYAEVERDGTPLGWAVWMFAVYAFYMSLCCTFFPLPTTGVVLLAASDLIASQIGISEQWWLRLGATATVGAAATGVANLNEYHVFTYLLRFRRVAGVRDTRLYRTAAGWFGTNPWLVIVAFSFIPIPVDVVRWLAITYRYSRWRYFWAYFAGRWLRYALWAATAIYLRLGEWHIAAIQIALAAIVLLKIVPRIVRQARAPQGAACDDASARVARDVLAA